MSDRAVLSLLPIGGEQNTSSGKPGQARRVQMSTERVYNVCFHVQRFKGWKINSYPTACSLLLLFTSEQGKVVPVPGFLHLSEIRDPYALEKTARAKMCEVEVKKGIHLTAYIKDVFPNAGRLTLSLDPSINKDKVWIWLGNDLSRFTVEQAWYLLGQGLRGNTRVIMVRYAPLDRSRLDLHTATVVHSC